MKILITGATGFIGTHLCRFVAEKGYTVRAIFRTAASRSSDPQVEWVHLHDIGAGTNWTGVLDGVTHVVHLAGVAHRVGVTDEELRPVFNAVNREGTRVLAEAIARSSVKRLVFVSSVAVLSADGLEQPSSPYGQSKLEGERALVSALQASAADWCILRPSMVYGPGDPGNMARLIRLSRIGIPLPLASVKNQKSLVYVGNLIDAVERCLTNESASRAKFIVSDGDPLSTPDLLRLLAACSSRPVRLFPVPPQALKAVARVGDVAKRMTGRSLGIDSYSVDRLCSTAAFSPVEIRNRTGWKPPFTTAEGLQLTLSSTNCRGKSPRA